MKRWKLTIEYKGSDYSGWQRQKNGPSIQQAIEEALYKFCQQKITLQAAGRTDAGVHARGQVAHFDLDYKDKKGGQRSLTGFDIAKAINAHLLPQPISILHAEEVSGDFHARFMALDKIYRYKIVNRRGFLAIDQGLVWQIKHDLDVPAMQKAAQVLIGKHDFTTFRDSHCQAKSAIRTLDRIDVFAQDYDSHGGREIIIEAQARSFLHHQIRNITGTLMLVGEGKWSSNDMKSALEAKDRTKGGPTAPSDGLYLMQVNYE